MSKWYDTDNLTDELQKQKQADFYMMFYGDRSRQACFASIISAVEKLPSDNELDTIKKEALREFVKQIKMLCGLDDFLTIVQSEAEALNKNFNK